MDGGVFEQRHVTDQNAEIATVVEERSDHVTGSVGAGQDADIADIVRQAEDGMGSTKPSRGVGLVVRGDDAVESFDSALAVGRGDSGSREEGAFLEMDEGAAVCVARQGYGLACMAAVIVS